MSAGAQAGPDSARTESPPQPRPDVDTKGWWEATAAGHLALCRCEDCARWLHPPLERCRHCGGRTRFEQIGATGRIHSFIVQHRRSVPGLGAGPHVIALVDLDAAPGVRLSGRVIGTPMHEVKIGAAVVACCVPIPGGDYYEPEFAIVSMD